MITADVTLLPRGAVHAGDPAELIGPTITLEEIADLAGTINYEILTGIGGRVRRQYTGGDSETHA